MSLEVTLARIAELHSVLGAPPAAAPAASPSAPTSFAGALQSANAGLGSTASAAPAAGASLMSVLPSQGTPAGQAIVNLVRGEVGQAEQPPGSNDSPRIAQYRQATAGSGVGPWCAYFASWAARQAGVPLGDHGQGFGAVSSVWQWAQQSGKARPAGAKPAPGDL